MSFRLLVCSSAIVGCFAAFPVWAADDQVQSKLQEHEKRIDQIDTKLDAIIDMLSRQGGAPAKTGPAKSQSGSVPVAKSAAPTSNAATQKPATGGLTAEDLARGLIYELYVIPKHDLSATTQYPAGFMVDESVPIMVFAKFMEDPSLKRNSQLPANYVLESRWSGYLKALEAGSHVILFEAEKKFSNNGPHTCNYDVQLNGRHIAGAKKVANDLYVDQPVVDLQPGLYPIAISLKCSTRYEDSQWTSDSVVYQKLVANLKIKTPSMRAPQTPDPGVFLHVK